VKFRHLRTLRIIISLLLLIISTFLFLDFNDFFSTEFISGFFYLQFIPSVLNFITTFSIAASGFIIVIITIVLFGRVYCSTICPLGILQDIIIYFSNKIRKRKFVFLKARNFLRYSIMIASVGFTGFGSMVLINLLDPYSNFGRIVSNLFRPAYYGANNLLAGIFESFNNYWNSTTDLIKESVAKDVVKLCNLHFVNNSEAEVCEHHVTHMGLCVACGQGDESDLLGE